MLTLLVTVLATAYLVVPELLTRFVVSFYFVRKARTGTRSEEILRASFWAIVPVLVAWSTRDIGWLTVPGDIPHSTQIVFAALYSDKLFEHDPAAFYAAFHVFAVFNIYLLLRTYFFVILGAISFGWIAKRLGAVRARLKHWPKTANFLHWLFMPRISESHIALSPMLLKGQDEFTVRIDVMLKNGILYRGNVFEKRISAAGDLATLILEDTERMIRDEYTRDRTAYETIKSTDPAALKPDTEAYWRKIPGEMFLVNGSEIATVNVRHVRPVGVLKPREDVELTETLLAIRTLVNTIVEQRPNPN